MKLEQGHIEEIRQKFAAMTTKEELVALLNYVKPFLYGKKSIPFELNQVTYYANPKAAGKRYLDFTVNKKSGGKRTIHAPVKGLKAIQRCLNVVLQCVFDPHKAAYGFVQDKSIVDNARIHAGSHYVYNIDLKDFFPSIDQARVWKCLQLPPFNLVKEVFSERMVRKYKPGTYVPTLKLGKPIFTISKELAERLGWKIANRATRETVQAINQDKGKSSESASHDSVGDKDSNNTELVMRRSSRLDLANMIAALCCTEMEVERKNKTGAWELVKRNVLPQGAPTSPIVTNIVCQRLDFLLTAVAKRFGCRYTRYADDITFSSMHNIYKTGSEFIRELERIVSNQGFYIKSSKTRLQKAGYRQEVTGLIVNEKVNVQRRYIKQLRKWLYLWERYGYEKAQILFLNDYSQDKRHIIHVMPNMENVIRGKLVYLNMVSGSKNKKFSDLYDRYKKLSVVELFKEDILETKINQVESSLETLKRENSQLINQLKVKEKAKEEILHHKPQIVVELLNKFTEDTYLKYTTHLWDKNNEGIEKVNRATFQSTLEEEFFKIFHFQQLKDLSKDLYHKLLYFTVRTSEKGWGKNHLKMNWQNEGLIKFYLSNVDLQPMEYEVPGELLPDKKINGKTLKYFEDFIDIFKSEIEFRDNAFHFLLKRLCEKYLSFDYSYKIDGLRGISFFTDTNRIAEVLEIIIKNLKGSERSIFPEVNIIGKYSESTNQFILDIEHIGSYSDKNLSDSKLNLKGKGQFLDIRNKLVSLCDWSVISKFKVGEEYKSMELIYLSADRSELNVDDSFIAREVETAKGFTYRLKFFL